MPEASPPSEVEKKEPPRWIDYMRVRDLEAALVNPKRHNLAELRRSLGRFGYLEAIVMDERTTRLVGGHGRAELLLGLEALPEAPADWPRRQSWPPEGVMVDDDGAWLVPVQRGWRSENDDEAHGAGITLNRQGELGGWDRRELAGTLDGLSQGPGLDGIGFDQVDVNGMLDDIVAGQVLPEEIPSPQRIELLPPNPRHHVLVTYLDPSSEKVRSALTPLEGIDGVELRWSP